ncbi:MAG TPA: ATP-binding cassette domain-containing protein [Candidatus Saccharimonadales bacterium]|nr:ATP-binding cassette domain-containing protein [Candidatus Saccharimonadales bacterium]
MKNKNDVILTVDHLVKQFDDFTAVNNISFTVNKREVFAFVGPNGAGKSTTIKMLITLLKPTSGKILIDKHNITEDPNNTRRVIGYVPQMLSVDGSLTAIENLKLMAKLYDIPRSERMPRIEEILTFLDLQQVKDILVKNFSGGMVRKLEIGQAMLHRPHVIFLDEPTTGLDPVARRNVWKHLLELRTQFGTTIFFSTHYMEEAEEVADRVAIMQKGNVAAIGTVEELTKQTKKKHATLEDAFIYFTGAAIQESGNIRDIKQLRANERRLG